MAIDGYKFSKPTGGGVGAMDAKDGADLKDLDLSLVLDPDSDAARLYLLDEDSGATADGERVVEPLANAGQKRWLKKFFAQTNNIPVGSIVPFIGGYFANGSNGGFVNVLGNDAASINSLVNGDGWYVCNGAELNLSGSPIYNGSGRHLPNLTDDRFIQGDTSAGAIGGSNASNHSHTVNIPAFTSGATTLSIAQMPAHTHHAKDTFYAGNNTVGATDANIAWRPGYDSVATTSQGGGGSHTHTIDPPNMGTSGASVNENRPKFLTAIYIQKAL